MIKVSIIVPVYNVEEYLSRCLDSLINQTLKDIEIIVVNDGTKDNSQEIIDKYKKKDKRIISLIKENGGLSSARNYGLKYASGEYIGYVDSDDWVTEDMFEKLYNKAKKEKSDIVVCGFYKAYDDGNNIPQSPIIIDTKDSKKNYLLGYPNAWNKLYKKGVIKENHWPEGMLYEDLASNPLLVNKVNKISYIEEPLYYYFLRANSIMNDKVFKPKFYDIIKASDILIKEIKKDSSYDKYYQEFEYSIIDNLLREAYFRLKDIEGSRKLLEDITIFIKDNCPKFMKNKYIKDKDMKYKIITYLIYKRKYKLLNFIHNRGTHGKS